MNAVPMGLPFRRGSLDVPVPAARRSATSKRAAAKVTGCRGGQMAKLLGAYAAVGVAGLTMSDVVARTGLRISSFCSLKAGAVKHGWLLPMAETRPAFDTMQDQGVSRITTTGLAALEQWNGKA